MSECPGPMLVAVDWEYEHNKWKMKKLEMNLIGRVLSHYLALLEL